jgi:hypothetical protein
MSLTTLSKIRELQSKLYRKAKKQLPVQSRGTRHFSAEVVFGGSEPCGFEMSNGILVASLSVKPVRKPDAGNPHVRFDERGWETGRRFGVSARAHPRLYKVCRWATGGSIDRMVAMLICAS